MAEVTDLMVVPPINIMSATITIALPSDKKTFGRRNCNQIKAQRDPHRISPECVGSFQPRRSAPLLR
jgi:hypothetical protein